MRCFASLNMTRMQTIMCSPSPELFINCVVSSKREFADGAEFGARLQIHVQDKKKKGPDLHWPELYYKMISGTHADRGMHLVDTPFNLLLTCFDFLRNPEVGMCAQKKWAIRISSYRPGQKVSLELAGLTCRNRRSRISGRG